LRFSFIYPGQGSQALGMGKSFFEGSAIAKELFSRATQEIGVDFEKLLFEDEARLNISEFSQPSIVLVSVVATEILKSKMDISPVFTMGHSLGEFSALYCAGAIKFEKLISLVSKRGKLMQNSSGDKEGGMCVVLGLDDDKVESVCESLRDEGMSIWCANYNCQGQVVVAGVKSDIESSKDRFVEEGAKRAMVLNMSVSSHNPLLSSIEKEFRDLLEDALEDSFLIPVISNVTAQPYRNKKEALELLAKQLTHPVRYAQSIKNTEDGCDCFVELGHGSVLSGLNKKNTAKKTHSLNSLETIESFVDTYIGREVYR